MKYIIILAFVAAALAAPTSNNRPNPIKRQKIADQSVGDKRQAPGQYFTYCCGKSAEDVTVAAEVESA
jgi:hypothetical protein